jgi:hypothetical protein
MPKYQWKHLNGLQVGAYAEYFVKMEFTMAGFQVFMPEVDDRGIDFIVRFGTGCWHEIQVKSVRTSSYIFLAKDKFALSPTLYAAIVILPEGRQPDLYLIPSLAWKQPGKFLVERTYEGLQSAPEWGINLSKRNMPLLEEYRFDTVVGKICQSSPPTASSAVDRKLWQAK